MANGVVQVHTTSMLRGSSLSNFAGEAAAKAADRLAESAVTSSIFGDFDAARGYHDTVSAAHNTHVERLRGHHATLSDISGKAHTAALAFDSTDGDAADMIHAARNGIDTADV